MRFINKENKFLSLQKQTNQNTVETNRLKPISLLSETATFNKKQNEIVLVEDRLLQNRSVTTLYTFNGLAYKDLMSIYPYCVFETTEAYREETTWVTNFKYYWEVLGNTSQKTMIFHVILSAYILLIRPNGSFDSTSAPVYANLKMKLLNPNMYIEIENLPYEK